jgi:hypothetical protein
MVICCNSLRHGNAELANLDPRRSVYLRRYIVLLATSTIIDGPILACLMLTIIGRARPNIFVGVVYPSDVKFREVKLEKFENLTNQAWSLFYLHTYVIRSNFFFLILIEPRIMVGICLIDTITSLLFLRGAKKRREKYIREELASMI